MMKTILAVVTGAILGAGCTTATAVRTAIGPDPGVARNDSGEGVLRVFSKKVKDENVGFSFPHTERTDYSVYDAEGREVKLVADNNKGEFEDEPRRIHLRAGKYTVKALAAVGYGEWLSVPVVVEAGKTTEVHLNGQWKAPDSTWGEDLVFSPSGLPMGWRANP